MGLLRFIFATNVLFAHTIYGYAGAVFAVPAFYILSGFYMALILSEKYVKKNNSYRLFITNRFLRIFPLYWTVLVLVFGLALIKFFFHIGIDNAISHMLTLNHESTGQFLNYVIRNVTLILTTDYVGKIQATDGYLLVQQAPTLQIELLFYLIVPFLVRMKNAMFSFVWLIYGLLLFTVIPMFFAGTLTEGFFNNLVFFLIGIVSYKLYRFVKKKQIAAKYIRTITISFLVVTIGFAFVSSLSSVKNIPSISWVYYVFLFPLIPFLFLFKNKLDVFLGELSYPLYLSHFLIIKLLQNMFMFGDERLLTIVVFVIATTVSILFVKVIEEPIDRFRQKRLEK